MSSVASRVVDELVVAAAIRVASVPAVPIEGETDSLVRMARSKPLTKCVATPPPALHASRSGSSATASPTSRAKGRRRSTWKVFRPITHGRAGFLDQPRPIPQSAARAVEFSWTMPPTRCQALRGSAGYGRGTLTLVDRSGGSREFDDALDALAMLPEPLLGALALEVADRVVSILEETDERPADIGHPSPAVRNTTARRTGVARVEGDALPNPPRESTRTRVAREGDRLASVERIAQAGRSWSEAGGVWTSPVGWMPPAFVKSRPCWCGTGRKLSNCHMSRDAERIWTVRIDPHTPACGRLGVGLAKRRNRGKVVFNNPQMDTTRFESLARGADWISRADFAEARELERLLINVYEVSSHNYPWTAEAANYCRKHGRLGCDVCPPPTGFDLAYGTYLVCLPHRVHSCRRCVPPGFSKNEAGGWLPEQADHPSDGRDFA